MNGQPSRESLDRIRRLVAEFTVRSGTTTHPERSISESVVMGLASHLDELGRALCPCRYYPDKRAEAEHRTWICPCDDMQIYKYCHCLLFVTEAGLPVTEYLPGEHDGRVTYGVVRDPTPELGRKLRSHAAARERERRHRPS